MLAKLLGVSVSAIRRWQRRGWIVPVREVRRLAYFDFQEVATARRLTELLAAGISPAAIEKELAALARYLPSVKRPLAQLSIIVEGKQPAAAAGRRAGRAGRANAVRLRRVADAERRPTGGQHRDGRPTSCDGRSPRPDRCAIAPAKWCNWPANWRTRANWRRPPRCIARRMAAGGPQRRDLLPAGRAALSDARSARRTRALLHGHRARRRLCRSTGQLGCVLAEMGEKELAISAFEGALAYHDAYPDAHYHLARILDDTGRASEAARALAGFLAAGSDQPLGRRSPRTAGAIRGCRPQRREGRRNRSLGESLTLTWAVRSARPLARSSCKNSADSVSFRLRHGGLNPELTGGF